MIIKENTIDNGCVNVTIKTIRTSLTEEALSVFKTIAYESKYLQIKLQMLLLCRIMIWLNF